jgi:hypothetical protein
MRILRTDTESDDLHCDNEIAQLTMHANRRQTLKCSMNLDELNTGLAAGVDSRRRSVILFR